MMTARSVVHATFSVERTYAASSARVFAAWADPASKARWFAGPDSDHQLDFRVGGREVNRARVDGAQLKFESVYQVIVAGERIVYTSTLSADEVVSTISLTTVELSPADGGTWLLLTEQGTFLNGLEDPRWREKGTGEWLDALGTELAAAHDA
jgi:uncharacterized protein YndB with AHSA1/START domain